MPTTRQKKRRSGYEEYDEEALEEAAEEFFEDGREDGYAEEDDYERLVTTVPGP